STYTISCRSASRSSTSAPNGAVAATAMRATVRRLGQGAEDRLRPEGSERFAPRVGGRPVEDQDPVEMVELVLHHPRVTLFELEPLAAPCPVFALDRARRAPLVRNRLSRHRETALRVAELDLGRLGQNRIHTRAGSLAPPRRLEDEPPLKRADLVSRQADA